MILRIGNFRARLAGMRSLLKKVTHMKGVSVPQRRSYKRLPFGFRAELVAHSVIYEAFVENISENGMNIKIVQISSDHNLDYVSDVALKIHPTFGRRIDLNGRKKWSSKISPNSIIESIGIEIIDPPPEYKKLYKIIARS